MSSNPARQYLLWSVTGPLLARKIDKFVQLRLKHQHGAVDTFIKW